jgi:hypothetical protein
MKHISWFEFDLAPSQLTYSYYKNIDGKNILQVILDQVRKELKDQSLDNNQLMAYFF